MPNKEDIRKSIIWEPQYVKVWHFINTNAPVLRLQTRRRSADCCPPAMPGGGRLLLPAGPDRWSHRRRASLWTRLHSLTAQVCFKMAAEASTQVWICYPPVVKLVRTSLLSFPEPKRSISSTVATPSEQNQTRLTSSGFIWGNAAGNQWVAVSSSDKSPGPGASDLTDTASLPSGCDCERAAWALVVFAPEERWWQ